MYFAIPLRQRDSNPGHRIDQRLFSKPGISGGQSLRADGIGGFEPATSGGDPRPRHQVREGEGRGREEAGQVPEGEPSSEVVRPGQERPDPGSGEGQRGAPEAGRDEGQGDEEAEEDRAEADGGPGGVPAHRRAVLHHREDPRTH